MGTFLFVCLDFYYYVTLKFLTNDLKIRLKKKKLSDYTKDKNGFCKSLEEYKNNKLQAVPLV